MSEQMVPPWVAAKVGSIIAVSDETLRRHTMGGHEPISPEQRAALDAWHVERRRLWDDHDARLREALAAVTDLTLRAVIDHHGPVPEDYGTRQVCDGCDIEGYEAERPEWPCSTVVLIGERLGVASPRMPEMPL